MPPRDRRASRVTTARRRLAVLAVASWLATSCGPALVRPAQAPVLLPCTDGDCLRVLTWNVHAIPFMSPRPSARLRNVAAKIREQQPDVVLLQEVWAHAYTRQLARDLAGAYRVTTGRGCGRPFPCGGLAILVRIASGWMASPPGFVAYDESAPWYRFREWDGIAKKGMLMVRLTRGAEALAVVDTHLQTEYVRDGRDYSELRRRQLEQLARTLRHTFGAVPALVGGDFNTAPGEPSGLYETHFARLGDDRTADLRLACGECGTRPAQLPPARWLDYLLTRNLPADVRIERIVNDGVDQPYSDHDGLLGRVEYAPGMRH